MSTLLFTILIAFVGVLTAVSLLGISWLLTGKSKIKPGACGKDPTKLRNENCANDNISCGLCNKKEIK
ncbi:MAG: hypothetical protein BGO14_03700 [Chlamydiales bacterium 38-26]|nr:hypothetical protein [Chlamydiales bacterium]OJV09438.1 MAG: hypothetical protein BGO14_03700 [Chlamydiales bacterium 38-26]